MDVITVEVNGIEVDEIDVSPGLRAEVSFSHDELYDIRDRNFSTDREKALAADAIELHCEIERLRNAMGFEQ